MQRSVWLLCNWADVIILSGFPVISSISSSHTKTSHRSELRESKKNNDIISDVPMEKSLLRICEQLSRYKWFTNAGEPADWGKRAFSWSITASEAASADTPKEAVTMTTGQ